MVAHSKSDGGPVQHLHFWSTGKARGVCLILSQQKWTQMVPKAELPAKARDPLNAVRASVCHDRNGG